jgi:hypothetical protein
VLDEKKILEQLEEVARALGIEIRYEPIRRESGFFPGGLCRLRGEDVLIINSQAAAGDKIETLVKALRHFDLGRVYMRPALREFLGNANESPEEE